MIVRNRRHGDAPSMAAASMSERGMACSPASVTQGGPSKATETLIYKVFNDGFIGLDFGGSSAQSVVMMLIVMVLTFLQFRYVERKVTY